MASKTDNNNNGKQVSVHKRPQREYYDPFDFFFLPLGFPSSVNDMKWEKSGEIVPRMDVHETDSEIVIECELAGVPKEKISLEVENDILTLSGSFETTSEESSEKGKSGKTWHRTERRAGSFQRSVTLPKGIDTQKITASTKDGILTVIVPKPQEPSKKSSRIEIK